MIFRHVLPGLLGLITLFTMDAVAAEKPILEKATLGGGCFWCLEAGFERFEGIHDVVSGYAAGKTLNPTYKQVCEGTTGHAEVVQIEFDPAKISYDQILEIFWEIHDPTTLNQQGADIGTQYRSIILYHNEAQKEAAKKSMAAVKSRFRDPITTQLEPLTKFYPAEDYHQDYFRKNPNQPYCVVVISPKLKKLEKLKLAK
jgi:peptide-methionine (S)-S-oxide reductase